jgi:hypothetical protein
MQLQLYSIPVWQEIKACYPLRYIATDSNRQPFEVDRVHREKQVLEQGLTDCAVYLKALRKKQARNERQLGNVAALSRRKQKQLQQTKRDLARDIKNRERNEQAFLFNLQACKERIHACNTLMGYDIAPSAWLDSTSTPTVCTPTLYSSCSTEATENSWNDGTDISPFRTVSSIAFYPEQNGAPKWYYRAKHDSATGHDIEKSVQWFQSTTDLMLLPPAPTDTAGVQFLHSELDPRADVFEPGFTYSHASEIDGDCANGRNDMSATACDATLRGRRLTDAGFDTLPARAEVQPSTVSTSSSTTTQDVRTKDNQAPRFFRLRAKSI